MRFKIVPSFLKRLDRYFLLNYRILWISKIHYVLFYSIVGFLLGSGLIYAYPLTTESSLPEMNTVFVVSCLLVAPACLYWVYWQTTYGIESQHGLRFRLIAYVRFALYLTCFGTFGILPIALTAMVYSRLAKLTSLEELVNDANMLNLGNLYVPSQIESDTLWYDTKLVESIIPREIYDGDSMYYSKRSFDTTQYYISGKDTLSDGYFRHFTPSFSYFSFDSTDHEAKILRKLKSYEDNMAIFFKRQNEAFMLEAIENYIKAFNKYSKVKIKDKPEVLLKSYLAKKVLLSEKVAWSKINVHAQIDALYHFISKPHPRHFVLPIIELDQAFIIEFEQAFVFVVFGLSILLFIFQYVRKIDFGIALVSLMTGGFFIFFISGFTEFIFNEYDWVGNKFIVAFLTGIAFFVLVAFSLKNYYQHHGYTRWKSVLLICTTIACFVTLLAVGEEAKELYVNSLIENLGLDKYYDSTLEEEKFIEQSTKVREIKDYYDSLTFYSLHGIYFLFFIPFFHTLFVRLRSLPKMV